MDDTKDKTGDLTAQTKDQLNSSELTAAADERGVNADRNVEGEYPDDRDTDRYGSDPSQAAGAADEHGRQHRSEVVPSENFGSTQDPVDRRES